MIQSHGAAIDWEYSSISFKNLMDGLDLGCNLHYAYSPTQYPTA